MRNANYFESSTTSLDVNNILRKLNEASLVLLSERKIEAAMTHALNLAGEISNADSIVIFENTIKEGVLTCRQTFEWVDELKSEPCKNAPDAFYRYEQDLSARWLSMLQQNLPVHGNVEDLPESEAHLLEAHGVKCTLLIPIFDNNTFWGFIGFNRKKNITHWSEIEVIALTGLANCIGGALRRVSVEKDLLKTQQALLEAQRLSRLGSFKLDFVKQTAFFTDSAANILFYKKEDLVFDDQLLHKLRKRVHRDDLHLIDKLWLKAMNEKGNLEMDFRIIHPETKEIRFIHWIVKPKFDSGGQMKSLNGIIQDITDRMALEHKDKLTSLIIQNSRSILFRWKVEENCPVEFVSENIRQIGYNPDDLLSGKIPFLSILHPEDKEKVVEEVKNYTLQGQDQYFQTYRILDAQQKVHWVEDQTTVIRNFKGEVVFHQGILTDITEKIMAEEALKRESEKLEALIDNLNDIITMIDEQGNIIYQSSGFYRKFDYTPDEVIGKNIAEFVHPDDYQYVIERILISLEKPGEPIDALYRFKRKDGSYCNLESIGSNWLNNPSIKALIINSRDITERIRNEEKIKQYAEHLAKVNKELDQFAYIVSHDLKAPLRAINNLSLWIEEDLAEKIDGDTRKNLELMRSRIGRMEALINGILQYSRAGRIENKQEIVNVFSFVKEIVANLDPPKHFDIRISDNLPSIAIEKIILEQVFSNYISNAIKYNNHPEPFIEIGYKIENTSHVFYVADNGPGIAPEFHEKVFVIFQTLQARDKVESTGVGLAIVKKMIEEKGGEVWLDSSVGKGATFYFSLPLMH